MRYHLAIDIGASSGRHILGHLEDGKVILEEIYRFENSLELYNDSSVWNVEKLFSHILDGLKTAKTLGKIPSSVAIDTWGVDYVLLDADGKEISPCVSYRDCRTAGVPLDVYKQIDKLSLFEKTGIQNHEYNTLFQLLCDNKTGKLAKAKSFLMMPEYFSYKLTGIQKHEYTICSTSNILNAKTKDWDNEIINVLGLSKDLFTSISSPSSLVGEFTKDVANYVGYNAKVLFAPSHDTASAVLSCPISTSSVFISSGTWSLVGTENDVPITDEKALLSGLSNEGGFDGKYRILKNIMGMWLFQSIKKELGGKYSYDELMSLAMKSAYTKTFDPTSPALLNPNSMINAVKELLGDVTLSLGDVLNSIYLSLAHSYNATVKEIENLTNKVVNEIVIVGGGSKDEYLNKLTAKITGKKVVAGPTECTALGNILSQVYYYDDSLSIKDLRSIVKTTFGSTIKHYA
ncbi:MAG: rhamnulokinase [Clostridia bacterium]|nr:rhamnulokinase [Clostridia bacterium]